MFIHPACCYDSCVSRECVNYAKYMLHFFPFDTQLNFLDRLLTDVIFLPAAVLILSLPLCPIILDTNSAPTINKHVLHLPQSVRIVNIKRKSIESPNNYVFIYPTDFHFSDSSNECYKYGRILGGAGFTHAIFITFVFKRQKEKRETRTD